MKAFILGALASLIIAAASATPYHAPAHNYYQNNWITSSR